MDGAFGSSLLGLGICCRNHVVFESQVKYHKHSLLRVSRATASVANQFPAMYLIQFSVFCASPQGRLGAAFSLDCCCCCCCCWFAVDLCNKQTIEADIQLCRLDNWSCVCECVCPLKTQLPLLPLDFWPGAGRQAGIQWCSSLCLGPLAAVNWSWSWPAPSPRHFYFRRHFSYNSMKPMCVWVCVHVCMSVCVCVDTCD